MTLDYSQPPTEIDELLLICASPECRRVLTYFREASDPTASLSDIVDEGNAETRADREQTALRLQHSALPRLAEIGYLAYDTRSDTVRYHGHQDLEALAAQIATVHDEEPP